MIAIALLFVIVYGTMRLAKYVKQNPDEAADAARFIKSMLNR